MASELRPRVGIIVIALNERENAPRCIRSILDQEADSTFEVVVVDDGSSDGTAEAVLAAAAGDARVRVVRLPENRGRGAARQAGIDATRALIIGFVDADITLPPDWLQRCLAELPGQAAVGGIPVPDGDSAVVARMSKAHPRVVAGSTPITGSNVLFDREVLEQYGFDPRDQLGEDFRLAKRLTRAGLSLLRVPGLVVRHDECKSYGAAIRWRFANGIDAASHAREFGRLRLADLVFLVWCGAWVTGLVGAAAISPWWLLLGPMSGIGTGVLHAVTRFYPAPVGRFLIACLLDVPLLAAYLIGRTVAAPRMILGRPPTPKTG